MIAWIVARTGLSAFLAHLAIMAAAMMAVLILAVAIEHHGERVAHQRDLEAALEAQDQALIRDMEAKQAEAAQMAADVAHAAQLETTLKDSYASQPDSAPSRVRLALECRRLRATPAARDPAFAVRCGPDSRAQAAPAH